MITSRSWPSLRGPITSTFGGSASGVHVYDDKRMVDSVDHVVRGHAVSTRCSMKLHRLIVLRILVARQPEGWPTPGRRTSRVEVGRSNNYEPNWVVENQIGPNALWLTEALTEIMPIEPGMSA